MEEKRAKNNKKQSVPAVRVGGRRWTLWIQSNVAEANVQIANDSDGGNDQKRGTNVLKRLCCFHKRRSDRANVAKVKSPLGIFLPFPGVPNPLVLT